ncbi:MAG TPA: isocitrate lyase/phosphoenolpyruvate mutase family protein [Gammaproteobacteria bacterium]|nr:isocitrate lyase/phosphoenolpyruvate mutase family protein [Gammaproteobacteria bacterium]
MSDQANKARAFHALHVPGRPLVLFNVWDPGSAKAVTEAGAKALATGSWSVAAANGYGDGEKIPLDLALGNLARIVAATALPVSVDIESGYGKTPEEVGQTIARTIEAGAVGCNLEDSFPENGTLRETAEQVQRIRHARKAAEQAGISYFINARTDVFFQRPAEQHDAAMVEAAIARVRAYADAGASGIFAPGLVDRALIARLAAASPLPLNVMVSKGTPGLSILAEVKVARVSHGPGPYLTAMRSLTEAARAAMA